VLDEPPSNGDRIVNIRNRRDFSYGLIHFLRNRNQFGSCDRNQFGYGVEFRLCRLKAPALANEFQGGGAHMNLGLRSLRSVPCGLPSGSPKTTLHP
jgi:hypothetical protein